MKTYLNPVTGEYHPLDIENPAPGIYQGVSHADYLKTNAVSRSSLSKFKESPESYVYSQIESSDAMVFGTQFHVFLMQPDEFYSDFVEGPEYARSNADKELRRELQSKHGIDHVYRPSSLQTFKEMRQFLIENYPTAAKILLHKVSNELVVIARHPDTGLLLKIKIDAPNIEAGWIIDLKTTECALWEKFRFSITNYNYDLQSGFYPLVCSLTHGLEHMQHFEIIAQEKKMPYRVRMYNMHEYVNSNIIESNNILNEFNEWIQSGKKFPDRMILAPNYSI